MAVGCVGVDLVELEGWRARASQIVRSSPDPVRSFKLLRDKAVSLFGLGDLRAPNKQYRRSSGPVSSTLVTSDAHPAGREDRSEVERPCCTGPAVCIDAGVAAAVRAQVWSLRTPGVHHHQPWQIGQHNNREGFVTPWSRPDYGICKKSVFFDGGLVPAAVICVRVVAIFLLKVGFFVKWLQWNITQDGMIKKNHVFLSRIDVPPDPGVLLRLGRCRLGTCSSVKDKCMLENPGKRIGRLIEVDTEMQGTRGFFRVADECVSELKDHLSTNNNEKRTKTGQPSDKNSSARKKLDMEEAPGKEIPEESTPPLPSAYVPPRDRKKPRKTASLKKHDGEEKGTTSGSVGSESGHRREQ